MKRATLLVAVCCLTFMSNAQNSQNLRGPGTEITSVNDEKPEFIATSDEVEIYYLSTTDPSGNVLLNIHFLNTSEEEVSFTWEIQEGEGKFRSTKSITIAPGKAYIQNAVLEMKGTFDFVDYTINLITI